MSPSLSELPLLTQSSWQPHSHRSQGDALFDCHSQHSGWWGKRGLHAGEAKVGAGLLDRSSGGRNEGNEGPGRRRWGYKGSKGGSRECLRRNQAEWERSRLRPKGSRGRGIKEDTRFQKSLALSKFRLLVSFKRKNTGSDTFYVTLAMRDKGALKMQHI